VCRLQAETKVRAQIEARHEREKLMLIKSPVIAAGSGSIAGLTASHNKGGLYLRARTIPTNPGTTLQTAVRAAMASLSVLWQDTLTALQRLAWETYAENVPLINKLGDPINVTGLNMYIRSNVGRLQAGLPRVDDGPSTFNLGEYTAPSFSIDTASDEVDVTFDNTDAWANEDDSALLVYGSSPKDPTINFFKGPYTLLDTIDGDSVTAPTSPAAIPLAQAIVAGQRNFFRIVVSRADGRLSADFRGEGDAS